MKKSMFNALQRFKEAIATDAETAALLAEREMVLKFDSWVNAKGYYRPEQSMRQVAEELGLSHSELSWVCQRVYGDSFLSLRRRLRLSDASRMLVEEMNVPISAIADRVGIPDRTNFRRQFYSEFGMTPQQWRDKHLP